MTIFIAKEAPVIVQTLLQVFQLVILLYRIYIFLHKAVRQLVLLGKKKSFSVHFFSNFATHYCKAPFP